MSGMPMIQLALDYVALPPALAVAQLVHTEVDILEIGTPLTKAEGMRAVAAVHALCPQNLILADVKSPDVGGLEAKICFDAGADWMTVMGAAPADTIKLALAEAKARPGKEVVIELTGIKDILAQAREWRSYGVERMCYHRGWDEGNVSRTWDAHDRGLIQELTRLGFKVSVAGHLEVDMLSFFQGLEISVFVIGRAIHDDADPLGMARRFRAAIRELWGGGVMERPGAGELARAAKAVRWGASELGLQLTVDGRSCAGCDAAGRYCTSARTELAVPAGMNGAALVQRIAGELDPAGGAAVGWTQPGTFYLDVGALARVNEAAVGELLGATGRALNGLGWAADTAQALTIAGRAYNEGR
jgi:3-dehydro-L-gulonate-6-phosphate decarboxylase